MHYKAQRNIAREHIIDREVRKLEQRNKCPRGTPGCHQTNCSPASGKSCYGPDAPPHVDMLGGPGDTLEAR